MWYFCWNNIPSRELTYPTFGQGKSSSKFPLQGICLCRERSNILCGCPFPKERPWLWKKLRPRHTRSFFMTLGLLPALDPLEVAQEEYDQNASRILIQFSVKSCQIQLVGHRLQAITRAVLAKAAFWTPGYCEKNAETVWRLKTWTVYRVYQNSIDA